MTHEQLVVIGAVALASPLILWIGGMIVVGVIDAIVRAFKS